MSYHVLLLTVLLSTVPGYAARTKRQIYDPQGSQQNYPPQGFGPQRPLFGRPDEFGPQNDQLGFDPQGDFDAQRPQQRPPNLRPQRPPSGFGPQRPPPGFDGQGPFGPGGPQQYFGPDGQQFIRPRPPYRPASNNPYTFPGAGLDPLGGISKALESIARYDDKRCVARMLCEITAGGSPGSGYRGTSGFFDFSGLRGLADLLGAMTNSEGASPMFMFGSAALLGASQRDPYRCYRSYPECPRDPDRLVDYLNNHNGGFFKMFNPGTPQEEITTPRPPYFRRGKKVRKQKYPPEGSNGYDENQPLSPSKDVPISGKPPILAETDYDNHDQSNYVTSRPPRDIYTNPTRPLKKRKPFIGQSSPSNQNFNNNNNDRPDGNRIIFDDNKITHSTTKPLNYYNTNKDYATTPKPTYNYDLYAPNRPQSVTFNNQYQQHTTPSPTYNQFFTSKPNYYKRYPNTTPKPNRGFVFQNQQNREPEYEYDDDDATSGGTMLFVTPIPSYGQPGNAYSNPSRVLWAQSSRPSKTSRNFDVTHDNNNFKFPNSRNAKVSSHGTSSLLFPTDRTGTGELRLDTEQLESSSSSHRQDDIAASARGGKSLQFPDATSQSKSSSAGSFTFPNP